MLNRSHDEHNSYQSVVVNVPGYQQQQAPFASLAMFGVFVVLLTGLAVIVYRLITDTIELLVGLLIGAFAMITALAPWLVGGAVLVALFVVALRSLPQAVAEASEIRYRLAAQRQPRMLEVHDVDSHVLDLRLVRSEVNR